MVVYNKLEDVLAEFDDSMSELTEVSHTFIDLHDKYVFKNTKDATLLKEKIKEKMIGIIYEDK